MIVMWTHSHTYDYQSRGIRGEFSPPGPLTLYEGAPSRRALFRLEVAHHRRERILEYSGSMLLRILDHCYGTIGLNCPAIEGHRTCVPLYSLTEDVTATVRETQLQSSPPGCTLADVWLHSCPQ